MGSIVEALNAGNTHRVKQAEVEGKRLTQASGNEKEAASMSLARFSQSLSNKRKLDAAGAQFTAGEQNIRSALDAAATGNFQERLRAAATLGEATVQAAAAGVGGGSVDAYNRTVRLNAALQEESNLSAQSSDAINATAQNSNVIKEAVANLGSDSFQGSFDYTVYLDHIKQKNVFGTALAASVATYFGGPQAGMAVMDVASAGNKFANNDVAGGTSRLNSALANGIDAYKFYSTAPTVQGPALTSTPQATPGRFWKTQPQGLNFNIK